MYKTASFILFISLLFCIHSVFAAPSITGIAGTASTGQTVTISGSSFGNNSLNQRSLQANIEAGTIGQEVSATGWLNDWGGSKPLVYQNDQYHSGSKSMKCGNLVAGSGDSYDAECPRYFSLPTGVAADGTFYLSYWVRGGLSNTSGVQWKMTRVQEGPTVVDGSTQPQIVTFNWFTGDQIVVDPGMANDQTVWIPESYYPENQNTWYRIEHIYKASSVNTANGTLTIRRTTDTGVITEYTWSNVRTHLNTADRFNGVTFQNYLGNSSSATGYIWMDDNYIAGTQARVELCSGSTWLSRGKCEVQVPTSWGASTIEFMVNTGNWAPNTQVYAYVVDETGAANSTGRPITVGSSSGSDVTSPTVTITSPTSASTYDNGSTSTISLSGTASDNVGVNSVTWSCPTCTPTAGNATGTTSWSTGTITLASGSNVITALAMDAAGNYNIDQLTVTYTPTPLPTCDADHLNLCTTQQDCEAVPAYWCTNTCQASPCPAPGPGGIYRVGSGPLKIINSQ